VLVDVVKARLDATYRPDGYNVGFNAGEAAGQTVDHLHCVIPRHVGDVPDPRGGIRHVIPGRGHYLLTPPPELPPLVDGQDRTLHLELFRCLRSEVFDRIDLIVSFIMKSGLAMIAGPLEDAVERGARTRILTTDYLQITDADALARLLDLSETWGDRLAVRLFRDAATSSPQGLPVLGRRRHRRPSLRGQQQPFCVGHRRRGRVERRRRAGGAPGGRRAVKASPTGLQPALTALRHRRRVGHSSRASHRAVVGATRHPHQPSRPEGPAQCCQRRSFRDDSIRVLLSACRAGAVTSCRHVRAALHPPEAALGVEHAGGCSALDHLAVPPALRSPVTSGAYRRLPRLGSPPLTVRTDFPRAFRQGKQSLPLPLNLLTGVNFPQPLHSRRSVFGALIFVL
jgi:hypothetical protein